MQRNQPGPLTRNEFLSIFLIVGGIALVIAGRFISLGPEWFWENWQKDITFYAVNHANYVYTLIYASGLLAIFAGLIISGKNLVGNLKQHPLLNGTIATIASIILTTLVLTNQGYPFDGTRYVQQYLSLDWLVKALYPEFSISCFISITIAIISFSILGYKIALGQSNITKIKADNPEYLGILKEPIQSNKRTTIGLLLAVTGFTYLLIGAWPDMTQPYPWQWQTQIAQLGNTALWILFTISFAALGIGSFIICQKSHKK
jgi:hypothetical protein